ncbi:MAG: hypothetical protein WDN28_15050 [Chthoniobacter sp.]
MPALDHVPEMRDDAALGNAVAVLIEIDAPRVARALGEELELMLDRMIAPHARVDARAGGILRAGLADVALREDAVAAVEPAVGPQVKVFNVSCVSP